MPARRLGAVNQRPWFRLVYNDLTARQYFDVEIFPGSIREGKVSRLRRSDHDGRGCMRFLPAFPGSYRSNHHACWPTARFPGQRLVEVVTPRPVVRALAGAATAAVGLAAYGRLVEPFWLEVTQIEIALPNLPPALDGLLVAQLSDLHLTGPVDPRDAVAQAIARCNQARPDVVVLTGDYVSNRDGVAALADSLAALQVRPAFAVLGNHDYRLGPSWRRAIEAALREREIDLLDNRSARYERNGAALWFVGVGDGYTSHDRLDDALRDVGPTDRPRVLLTHYPDLLFDLPTDQFDLALAGHSHGGQIALPFLVERALARSHTVFSDGLYRMHGLPLYVSRGLGTSGYRVRLFARPELAMLRLRRCKDSGQS